MRNAQRLADEVRRAAEGEPWYGPSAKAVLTGVEASLANTPAPGDTHTIWQIALHTTVWARYVAKRLGGAAPHDPVEGNWPAVSATDEAAWAAAVEDLYRAHRELVEALLSADDAALDLVDESTPHDDNGEPVTLSRSAAGVAQHTAYHCGQVTVLKQALGVGTREK